MTANEMWIMLNHTKYECIACGYKTHNRSHYYRHHQSTRHWLLHDFRIDCPTDLKVLIASFLPIKAMTYCGANGLKAMNMQARNWGIARFISSIPPSAGLHVRICGGRGRITRSSQTPASVLQLAAPCEFSRTISVMDTDAY